MLQVQVGAGSPSSARDPGHTTFYQREFTKQIPPETSHASKPTYNINTALGLFKNDNLTHLATVIWPPGPILKTFSFVKFHIINFTPVG